MRRRMLVITVAALLVAGSMVLYAQAAGPQTPEATPAGQAAEAAESARNQSGNGLLAVGVGLAVLGGAIGTGLAQMSIGAAVTAACAEDRKFFGLGLLLLALPETILILSLGLALMLLFKIV